MVYLGEDSPLSVVGHGSVLIRFPNGIVKGINGILHILDLARNLLLISTLNSTSVQ